MSHDIMEDPVHNLLLNGKYVTHADSERGLGSRVRKGDFHVSMWILYNGS
jgi:hypothetical protein